MTWLLLDWQKALAGIVGAGLLICVAGATMQARHWHKRFDQERAAHALDLANVRTATAQAQAADEAHARAVQTRDATIQQEVSHDLQTQLADARAAADRYSRLHPYSAGAGGCHDANVPTPAPTASRADAAGPAPNLDAVTVSPADVAVCSANTVLATGWQEWWQRVSAAPR